MSKVHSEIMYTRQSDGASIHSDTCPKGCDSANLTNKEYKKYLHSVLEEWLNNSKGTGIFYIKEEGVNPFEESLFSEE